MVKATAPLPPRQVLGNQHRPLSIKEASAALVAMLGGNEAIPPRSELRKIVRALGKRQQTATRRMLIAH